MKKIDEIINFLENNSGIHELETGIGYDYDKEIYDLLDYYESDYNYQSHYDIDKPIEKYNKKELRAILTAITRAERFCDGAIAAQIEEGTLLKIAKRIKEIE